MRTTFRILTATMLALAALVVAGGPVAGACHIAAFETTEASVSESDGQATLLVVLQGRQPSCEGTVDFATQDGTATAGEDYEATQGTLEFVSGDDREEMVVVPIIADDTEEGEETFTIVLSGATGGISGSTTPATITITDGAGAAPDEGATATAPADDGATPEDATDATDAAAATDGDDGGSGAQLAIIAVVLVALLGVGALAIRRRQG